MSHYWTEFFASPSKAGAAIHRFRVVFRHGYELLYLPDDDLDSSRILDSYAAQTLPAKIYFRVLSALFSANLPTFQKVTPVAISEAGDFGCFLSRFSENGRLPRFGVLCGNPRVNGRRFIFILTDPEGIPSFVVKVGSSRTARELIRKEALFLKSIPKDTPGIPAVLDLFDTSSTEAFAMKFFPGTSPKGIPTEAIGRVLSEWVQEKTPKQKLASLPLWQEMARLQNPLFRRIQNVCGECPVHSAISHGDFAPWNIRESDGVWTVLDWERGRLDGIPGWDWFHYIVQTSVLVRKESSAVIYKRLKQAFRSADFTDYANKCGIAEIAPALLAAYLIYSCNSKQAEGADKIENLLFTLDTYWPDWEGPKKNRVPAAMQSRNLFSIVTPSYGQLELLSMCAASVRDQVDVASNEMGNGECGIGNGRLALHVTRPPLAVEHIIQDAGSPGIEDFAREAGAESCREGNPVFRSQISDFSPSSYRIAISCERDRGMYDAINKGFYRASGEILAWLNSDEQYLPGTLKKVHAYFQNHPEVDVVFGDALLVAMNGEILSYRRTILPDKWHTQLSHLNTLSCTTFVRRSVIERGLLPDASLKAIADAKWVVQMIEAGIPMGVIQEPLAVFTITQSNLGQTSLSYTEMMRWRKSLGKISQTLRLPIILLHRIKKLFAGAYGSREVTASFFSMGNLAARCEQTASAVPFSWPSAERPQHPSDVVGLARSVSPKKMLLQGILVPLVYSIFAQTIDQFVPGVTLTPFFSIVFLLCMAFSFPPIAVFLGATVFSFSVFLSFVQYGNPLPNEVHNNTFVAVRMASFLTAEVVAVLFSVFRKRAASAQQATSAILSNIPVPILVSDATGVVSFANQKALQLLNMAESEILGQKWASLVMADCDEGTSTRTYVELFASYRTGDADLVLHPYNEHRKPIPARLLCLGSGGQRIMVTVLLPS